MKLLLYMMVFVNVYIHFQIWARIHIRVTDPDPQHWYYEPSSNKDFKMYRYLSDNIFKLMNPHPLGI
jgi:hypothetical protein